MNEHTIQLNQPYRLHASFLLSELLSTLKSYFFPILLFWIVNRNSESMFIMFAKWGVLALVALSIVSAILQWFHFRYTFTETELQIKKGGLVRKEQYIQYHRIQNVSRATNLIGKIFRVTTVKLETEAQDDATVHLKMVTHSQANAIQTFLEWKSNHKTQDTLSTEVAAPSKALHYKVTKKELVKASFTSFSIVALIPILMTIFFNIDEVFPLDGHVNRVTSFLWDHWIWLTFAIICLLMISCLFGVITTFLQFGRFEVRSDEKRIYIKKGIIQEKENAILKSKVQGVVVSKSLIRRWFGMAKVKLVCAGGEGWEDDSESAVIFPFISVKRIPELLPEIIPGFVYHQPERKLPRRALRVKLLRPSYFWIIVTVVIVIFWSNLWYLSLILLALIGLSRLMDFYFTRYQITESMTQFEVGGVFNELTTTSMNKVEEVKVTRSWLQRRFGLASIQVATRGKPIHIIMIHDIPESVADDYYMWFEQFVHERYHFYVAQNLKQETMKDEAEPNEFDAGIEEETLN
ncbi:PH domain-containing protein [Alkalihalobacillus sp. FSL R5-0424]